MEERNSGRWSEEGQFQNGHFDVMSPEIVEIDESKSFASSRDAGNSVYVAVGKEDLDVLKWALNHAVMPGNCVFLIHVFPPVNYIPTPGNAKPYVWTPAKRTVARKQVSCYSTCPQMQHKGSRDHLITLVFSLKYGFIWIPMAVGKMLRSQAGQEQVNCYLREENTRRRNLLQKYVRLCDDAKVTVETMLIESTQTAKAILELIPVLNITMLVMGTKRPASRILRMGMGKGEFVQKNAPDFCEVAIVCDGKKVLEGQQVVLEKSPESNRRGAGVTRHPERNFFDCVCFSGKDS
ncbi:hypothetical protein IFM89_002759 [Coptis chinensis]|uniref:UspA domain-containing protein n=1 Tax=Coptis chinensis TaxID=261450 RepID=A0A835HSY7_9MAGN|nr:hypothetical protein IFM89_002759 [Coptis chinensis]